KAPSRKRQGGFTLTELMIALLVASLVLAGYIGANIQAQRNNEDLHERTLALQDANRVIEQMRNASRTGDFPHNVVTAFPENAPVEGYESLQNETVTVAYANSSANPLTATITVTWTSYTGRDSAEQMTVYITQR
ncbi:MAG: type II secretion system GspH family protein, partial [Candidatus Omnitrophica bacterium]|nr:type II secretion system GspH family protein [Candidatus Omnitrophota bacterium]